MPAFNYQEVTWDEVPAENRVVALDMKAFVENDLSLLRLDIRWFKKVNSPRPWRESFQNKKDIAGTIFYLKDLRTIWVSAELTPQDTGKTIAHEARHIHQRGRGMEGDEADARRYEEFAIRVYKLE